MGNNKQHVLNGLLAFATIFAVAQLWHFPLALGATLLITSLLFLKLNWSSKPLHLYVGAFILGPAAEILAIAHGVWSYADPHFLGIPVWLPFVWGNAAVFVASWRSNRT